MSSVSTVAAVQEEQAVAMRRLWCAVLYEQLRLCLRATADVKYAPLDIEAAYRWIGSRDFRTVCALAGLDADWIEAGVRARIKDGSSLIRWAA